MASVEPFAGLKFGWSPTTENFSADMDQNLQTIGILLSATVQSIILAAPPMSPSNGSAYIVGASPTGAWAGKSNYMAAYVSSAWQFIAPRIGMKAYNIGDGLNYLYSAGAWNVQSGGGGGGGVTTLGGVAGAIALGTGLSITGGTLNATGGGGSGAISLISTQTLTSSATEVDFIGCFSSDFDEYVLEIVNFQSSQNFPATQNLVLQYGQSGTPLWDTANIGTTLGLTTNVGATWITSAIDEGVTLANKWLWYGTGLHLSFVGSIKLFMPQTVTDVRSILGTVAYQATTSGGDAPLVFGNVQTTWASTIACDSLRLRVSTGTIESGSARLYGVANS